MIKSLLVLNLLFYSIGHLMGIYPRTTIGQGCRGNYAFQLTDIKVNPWPPKKNTEMKIMLKGYFKKEAYVADFYIISSRNHEGMWLESTKSQQAYYRLGDRDMYSIEIFAGNETGMYQLKLMLNGNYGRMEFCWQVYYELYDNK